MYQAIDVHGHFGDPTCFPKKPLEKQFMNLSLSRLEQQYRQQNVTAAFLSPMEALFPAKEAMILDANRYMEELSAQTPWMYQWVVVDPLYPATYGQAEQMLKNPKCVGVKIHPDANGYAIKDYADDIFSFCHANGAILETHSGDINSMPEVLIPFANQYPKVKVIVSHLGCGCDGNLEHQVNAIKGAEHHNIYTDVSSAKSLLNGLVEWAVEQVPLENILFGTDTPLHNIPMMKQRIQCAELSEAQKRKILYENAAHLFAEKLQNPKCR